MSYFFKNGKIRLKINIALLLTSLIILVFIVAAAAFLFLPQVFSQEESAETTAEDYKEYYGYEAEEEKISLDLKGVDIVELFKILSIKTGLNIVPSKNVSGRIIIYLNDVTFRDALEIILVANGLAMERKGTIINVMTSAEYENLYGKKYYEKRTVEVLKLVYANPVDVFKAIGELKSSIGKIIVDESSATVILVDIPEKIELIKDTITSLETPPSTTIFNLKHSSVDKLQESITGLLTTGPGSIIVDTNTNKLIISDLPKKMKKIRRVINAMDDQVPQVLIEAQIVQLTLSDTYKRGIDWERFFGTGLQDTEIDGDFTLSTIGSTIGQLQIGRIGPNHMQVILQLLETMVKTEIISRPKILVLNNQEASILVGSKEAYVTQTISQGESTTTTAESVEYIDVGVKLTVTPTIARDGFITLKIKPEVSSVRETLTTSQGSSIPIVETSEAETTAKVKDGQVVMIAGLMKDEDRVTENSFPFLNKIPFIRWFFGNVTDQVQKTELVVFLIPRIVTGESGIFAEGNEVIYGTDPIILPDKIMPQIGERRWLIWDKETNEAYQEEFIERKSKTGAERGEKESMIDSSVVREKLMRMERERRLKGLREEPLPVISAPVIPAPVIPAPLESKAEPGNAGVLFSKDSRTEIIQEAEAAQEPAETETPEAAETIEEPQATPEAAAEVTEAAEEAVTTLPKPEIKPVIKKIPFKLKAKGLIFVD